MTIQIKIMFSHKESLSLFFSPKSTQTARTMKSTASEMLFNLSDLQPFIISIIIINKR